MASFEITAEGNLLIVSVAGNLTAHEVIAVVNEYYSNGQVKDVIWDLTHATLHAISQVGFRNIARAAKESLATGARSGGKTAYVDDSMVEYGLLRMYTTIAQIMEVPVQYNVFRTMAEARSWMACSADGPELR